MSLVVVLVALACCALGAPSPNKPVIDELNKIFSNLENVKWTNQGRVERLFQSMWKDLKPLKPQQLCYTEDEKYEIAEIIRSIKSKRFPKPSPAEGWLKVLIKNSVTELSNLFPGVPLSAQPRPPKEPVRKPAPSSRTTASSKSSISSFAKSSPKPSKASAIPKRKAKPASESSDSCSFDSFPPSPTTVLRDAYLQDSYNRANERLQVLQSGSASLHSLSDDSSSFANDSNSIDSDGKLGSIPDEPSLEMDDAASLASPMQPSTPSIDDHAAPARPFEGLADYASVIEEPAFAAQDSAVTSENQCSEPILLFQRTEVLDSPDDDVKISKESSRSAFVSDEHLIPNNFAGNASRDAKVSNSVEVPSSFESRSLEVSGSPSFPISSARDEANELPSSSILDKKAPFRYTRNETIQAPSSSLPSQSVSAFAYDSDEEFADQTNEVPECSASSQSSMKIYNNPLADDDDDNFFSSVQQMKTGEMDLPALDAILVSAKVASHHSEQFVERNLTEGDASDSANASNQNDNECDLLPANDHSNSASLTKESALDVLCSSPVVPDAEPVEAGPQSAQDCVKEASSKPRRFRPPQNPMKSIPPAFSNSEMADQDCKIDQSEKTHWTAVNPIKIRSHPAMAVMHANLTCRRSLSQTEAIAESDSDLDGSTTTKNLDDEYLQSEAQAKADSVSGRSISRHQQIEASPSETNQEKSSVSDGSVSRHEEEQATVEETKAEKSLLALKVVADDKSCHHHQQSDPKHTKAVSHKCCCWKTIVMSSGVTVGVLSAAGIAWKLFRRVRLGGPVSISV